MIQLNKEQRNAVNEPDDLIVTACPGSGKTRVLTARLIKALGGMQSRCHRVVALTYTNRAADEIQSRLDEQNIERDQLWAGTIHAFALEWILRPYAPYCDELCRGFTVANDYFAEKLLDTLKQAAGKNFFFSVKLTLQRDGSDCNTDPIAKRIFQNYKGELRREKLIDFDDVLYIAYRLLQERPDIAETLGSIVRVILVDEVQDIQDLQYAILSSIHRAAECKPTLFFVGDVHQSIYETLGAMAKSPAEIAQEFGTAEIKHLELQGNYRSSQRIIDFYRKFRPTVGFIEGRSAWATERGTITFDDQTIPKENLAASIATRITAALRAGVPAHEICVVAPQWMHIRPLARRLVALLPEVDFDAPGLSPLHSAYENFWFKIARLVLTRPTPTRTRTRMRWASETLVELRHLSGIELPANIQTPRRLLRLLNGLVSTETDGLKFLADLFDQFLTQIALDPKICVALHQTYEVFFAKAENNFANTEDAVPRDVESFRRLFNHPSGVVINTCHGVKGEEYDTVIAFGLLRGYVPHWNAIINQPAEVSQGQEAKLLYVICSRAKRRLHLIAETGRRQKNGKPYYTADMLRLPRAHFD
jgi:DNA helicase-2/ATP-dependent DNA helicase PcrA